MKDTVFSCSFFVVHFGGWSTRPTTTAVIADDFKDVMGKGKRIKNIYYYINMLIDNGEKDSDTKNEPSN